VSRKLIDATNEHAVDARVGGTRRTRTGRRGASSEEAAGTARVLRLVSVVDRCGPIIVIAPALPRATRVFKELSTTVPTSPSSSSCG